MPHARTSSRMTNAGWYDAVSGDRRDGDIQMLDSSIFRDQMTVRRLRLAAGLVMLCYLTLHLSMHALGNVSFEAMQWGTRIHDFVWHSALGTIALYGASQSILLSRSMRFMPAGASVWVPAN